MDFGVGLSGCQKICFLGQKNIQNSLMLGRLHQKLGVRVQLFDQIEQLLLLSHVRELLLLLDCHGMRLARCTQLLDELGAVGLCRVALVNVLEASALEQLISSPLVYGIFDKSSSVTHLSKGIQAIMRGEFWFSRRLLHTYLQQHRREPNPVQALLGCLTRRERQVLRLTATGATNAEIACELRVSAHTVKTHMYNLFKKIEVSNRMQAIHWAKEYLSDLEMDFIE